jgi:hypothetical protein
MFIIHPASFLHRWWTAKVLVLELSIDVGSFFHLVFSIPRRGRMAETRLAE